MSGHNKWSTIKNKKAKTDAAKGKIFTKIGREIVIAVKAGGSADPAQNSKLKDVIAKAKAANMPNDNIQRSIKKAAGEGEAVVFDQVLTVVNDADVKIGTPVVEGAKVTGKVEAQGKDKKILVFKYKAKSNYRKRQGHRQPFTKVVIEKIEA